MKAGILRTRRGDQSAVATVKATVLAFDADQIVVEYTLLLLRARPNRARFLPVALTASKDTHIARESNISVRSGWEGVMPAGGSAGLSGRRRFWGSVCRSRRGSVKDKAPAAEGAA